MAGLTDRETRHLLAVAMSYDNRKPSDPAILAWTEASTRARWTFAEAVEAVHEHYANSTEFLMPAHVTERIKSVRQDAAMREPLEHPDPIGHARLQELISGAFRSIDDDQERAVRHAAMSRRCPFCGAPAWSPCTRTGIGGRVTPLRTLHPSRLEESAA